MFDHCQAILINNLYGLLTINTTENNSLCRKSRQWYFFYNYGYSLLIRFINLANLISNSYRFQIYSIVNKEKIFLYDSTNKTIENNEIQFDIKMKNSGIFVELISIKNQNLQQTSFLIDYVFRETSQSHYGREILQDNSSSSTSSQPTFIALICIVAILIVSIFIAILILCYRHYSRQEHSKNRHNIRKKFRRNSTDQAHLASSSTSSYSIRSSQNLVLNQQHTNETPQQTLSIGQNTSTLPSIIPSRRLQQSMIDAYLNDFNSIQPKIIDPKQLNSYLFIDLHSTSSETFPDIHLKKYLNDNTTTSGYDTSTGGEEKNNKNSLRYRRRRRYYRHQRQRRRSTLTLKRSNGSRFLMRERSLPNTLLQLPQLRQQQSHLFPMKNNTISSTTSNNKQDLITTDLSVTTTDDYDENHAYHVNENCIMDTIEEEKPSIKHQPFFFEMVSTHRGDDSDMPNYEQLPIPFKSSYNIVNGIAYINESIIV